MTSLALDRRAQVAGAQAADPVLAAVLQARRPSALAAALHAAGVDVRAARVVQTHYKPFVRARLLIEADSAWLFAEIHADAGRAQQALEESKEGARLLDPWCAVLWRLPHAPRLAHAAFCFERAAFARFAQAHALDVPAAELPQLVRYVPKRRALFRCGALYIKCYRRGRDAQAALNLRALEAAQPLGFAVPALVAHDAECAAVVTREIAGMQFTTRVDDAAECARAGAALARLHGSGVVPQAQWTAADELAALRKAMADVARALPDLTAPLERLLDELHAAGERLDFPTDAPIHGNLFGDQILVAPQGTGIVDWDDLARGDPLYDLGRLAAHLIYLRLVGAARSDHVAALCAGYGGRPDAARLRWQIAVALLMRAKISSLRLLPPHWPQHLAAAVRAAAELLQGQRNR